MRNSGVPELPALLRHEASRLIQELSPRLERALDAADSRIALSPGADEALRGVLRDLPEDGIGATAAMDELFALEERAGGNTTGPRCFHFVIGGATPAALGADLLAAVRDVVTYTWVLSPVGVTLEIQALRWLRELFGLPREWSGVLVTGATMANMVGLAAARQWWGEQQGVDVGGQGMSGLPEMPVLTSGFVHASARRVLGLLGVGRDRLRVFRRDEIGHVDLVAMERHLEELDGAPAVVVVNAGEVNAGEFDPVAATISLARRHNCWVHVDGAFGLFAAVSPRTAHLVAGVEDADSVCVDGHKWLNVPYDSGFAFVRDHGLMARAFRYTADYLPPEDDPRPTPGAIGPESSRRARSFAVWATLLAYGRSGHRALVEHCLDLARQLANRASEHEDLQLMADVGLNIVPFRFNPSSQSLDDEDLDILNARLGEELITDGRFLVGTSKIGRHTILRPAFSNWRTRPEDVDEFVDVVLEIGRRLAPR